jgi:CHAT domain-containing protein
MGRWAALFALIPLAAQSPGAWAAASAAPNARSRCIELYPASVRVFDRTVAVAGNQETRLDLPATGRADLLVYGVESGVDVEIEARDAAGGVVGTADNPQARSGIQRLALGGEGRAPYSIVVRGREHPRVTGSVRVLAVATGDSRDPSSCASLERALASADTTYARAHALARAPRGSSTVTVRSVLELAAGQYEKAAAALGAAGRVEDQGEAELAVAALNYYELSEWARSASWAEKAAATLQKAGDAYARARAEAILAAAWLEIGTKSSSSGQTAATPTDSRLLLERARTMLARLAAFHAARGETYDRALQINNIGLSYLYEARFEPAILHFTRANEQFETLGETQRIAIALMNIGLCEWGLGRLTAALPRFDRTLALMTPQPYADLYLSAMYSSGLAHNAAGRFDDALRLHTQGLEMATRLQLDRARGRSLYGIGLTYYAIGDRDLALRFLRSALEILTGDVDARARVAALRALAVIEHETGEFTAASAHNSEALRLATPPSARSRILVHLASDYVAQGQTAAARTILNSLTSIAPNGDAVVQALARTERAKLLHASGDLAGARRDVEAAIATFRSFEAVMDEFDARVELARIERDSGNDEKALAALTRALSLTEEITAQTANPEYRASIAQSIRPALDMKIDLLWRRYERLASDRNPGGARAVAMESLRAADDSRAVAFEQIRAQRLGAGDDPKIAELQRSIAATYRDMAERRYQLSRLEDTTGANDTVARSLREDIGRLRAKIGIANAELAARAAPRGGTSRGIALGGDSLGSPRAGRPLRAAGIDSVLVAPPTSAFIEYWVGEANTYAWAISRGELTWYRLAASDQVERVARGFHEAMRSYATTPARTRLDLASDLYRLTMAPLRQAVAGATELTIVPDGPLHYVPFLTLRDSQAAEKPYLVQNYGVALAPALRLISSRAAGRPASWADSRMLLVADPVYRADDPRLQRSARTRPPETGGVEDILRMRDGGVDPARLERLVSSARESERIRSLGNLGRVDVLEGFDATRANVLGHDLSGYRFIHIASHGIIDSEIPQLSSLILGAWDRNGKVTDQYVRAGDLMGLTLDAEVVVLSACDTALGREFAGEGLIGLRYAALARGARSVVGTLWPVSDAIAADVMTDMYRNITASGQPVEMALSSAIRSALVRTPALDPALWGPFAVYVAND